MNLIQLFVCCWLSNAERRILSRGVKAVGPAKPLKEERFWNKNRTHISVGEEFDAFSSLAVGYVLSDSRAFFKDFAKRLVVCGGDQ